MSLASPALAGILFITVPPGKPPKELDKFYFINLQSFFIKNAISICYKLSTVIVSLAPQQKKESTDRVCVAL